MLCINLSFLRYPSECVTLSSGDRKGSERFMNTLQSREYWMIYRGPSFHAVLWFSISPPPAPHPFPPSTLHVVSLSQSSCVSPVELNDERGREGGGRGTKTYHRETLALYKSFKTLCCSVLKTKRMNSFTKGRERLGVGERVPKLCRLSADCKRSLAVILHSFELLDPVSDPYWIRIRIGSRC